MSESKTDPEPEPISFNPWSDPYQSKNKKQETNPQTNKLETKEHQQNRLELEHFCEIVQSFNHYTTYMFKKLETKHYDWTKLPLIYKNMTSNFPKKFNKIKKAIIINQSFISLITQHSLQFSLIQNQPSFINQSSLFKEPTEMNMSKVGSTLRQLARDWSDFGKNERNITYGILLNELNILFNDKKKRNNINILNPGCGLGRLPYEIAKMGFNSQGNEFSYFMLLVSHFMLNKNIGNKKYTIYPFIEKFSNLYKFDDQIMCITVPDIVASHGKNDGKMSMVAGDFMEIYSDVKYNNYWDCIVSCFFIDTAHNILDYFRIFNKCIKIGGYLINIGPLLYHFDDMYDPSIELTYDEIKKLFSEFGFELIKEKLNVKCEYTQNKNSMLRNYYNCVFFVLKKVKNVEIKFENDHNMYLNHNLMDVHSHEHEHQHKWPCITCWHDK